MKIVFFGYDHSLDIALQLLREGHQIVQIFTFPCDNVFAFNKQTIQFAQNNGIPVTSERISEPHINILIKNNNIDLFLCCGYPYKIPTINNPQIYALNLHPALLPRARGIMPLPYIIYHEPESCGLTLHKLNDKFDCGDILAQLPLKIEPHETVDHITALLGLISPEFISKSLKNLENLWMNAKPQNSEKSSRYPLPDENFRTLDWNASLINTDKKLRAFGRFGVFADIVNNVGETQKLIVYQGVTRKMQHNHAPGELLRSSPREIIISAKEGYIILSEFSINH